MTSEVVTEGRRECLLRRRSEVGRAAFSSRPRLLRRSGRPSSRLGLQTYARRHVDTRSKRNEDSGSRPIGLQKTVRSRQSYHSSKQMVQEGQGLHVATNTTPTSVTVRDSEGQKVEKYRRLIGVPRNFARVYCKSSPLEWTKRLLESGARAPWRAPGPALGGR